MTMNCWRRHPNSVHKDEEFIAGIMEMWQFKLDTAQMAKLTLEKEAACLRALWVGRERQRELSQPPQT